MVTQPKVLARFRAMVGADAALTGAPEGGSDVPNSGADPPGASSESPDGGESGRGLPDILGAYLRAEQQLGRIAGAADIEAR